jgi:heavy metal sensor kinase
VPIRVRLTAWYVLLLAAIVVGLGAIVTLQAKRDLLENLDREVDENAAQIGSFDPQEGTRDFLEMSRTVLPGKHTGAQLISRSGRVIAGYGVGARPGAIAPDAVRAVATDSRRRLVSLALGRPPVRDRALVTPLRVKGQPPRVLVVAQPLREVDASTHEILLLLLLGGPVALAATGLGGWWLARKALRPVGRMTSEAGAIGIDRLGERVAVPHARDEIAELAMTLNAMLDRLEAGVREKHRLIADASHELRTPLSVMRAELDVTLRSDTLSEEARDVLESAREEVDRMSRTVANLLTLAQVDEGRLELLTASVTLHDAIAAATRPLLPVAAAKGVRLDITGAADGVRADPERLHQALTNLIENAIKFTPREGEVHVTAWERGDEIGVTVTDTGPGIPAEALPRVFDRFYRVDSARGRDAGGSGLGLAICREIAAAHGGRVWVKSTAGAGSAFSLALPRTRARRAPERAPVSAA